MVAALGPALVAAAATTTTTTVHASWVDVGTFAVAAAIILSGAVGVVVARNPVHSALMLVMTLFGVAVLFVLQRDPFLAAVQVIVYAGAIVVLFLFVIMFLGVDRQENIALEPLRGQRPRALGLVVLGTTGLLLLGQVSKWTTGAPHVAGVDAGKQSNVYLLGKSVYTTYLFPFEATAALLVIAVVGAVVLARRPPAAVNPTDGEGVGDGVGDGDDVPTDPDQDGEGEPSRPAAEAGTTAGQVTGAPGVTSGAGSQAGGSPAGASPPAPATPDAVAAPEEARS
jgi:NADH-quinone oxidoreductase subunit J